MALACLTMRDGQQQRPRLLQRHTAAKRRMQPFIKGAFTNNDAVTTYKFLL